MNIRPRPAVLGLAPLALLIALLAGTPARLTRAAASSGRPAGGISAAAARTRQASPTLTLALAAEPQSLDPARSSFQQDVAVENLLWRGLFRFDSGFNPLPAVAAEIPTQANGGISADGLTYTIFLRQGQTFSDGTPLTATDFVYSILRMLDPAMGSPYAGFYYDIAGAQAYSTAVAAAPGRIAQLRAAVAVKAIDDQTLQIRLLQPSGSLVARLALWPVDPVERAAVEAPGGSVFDAGTLVGNGPFVLAEHVPNDHLTLLPNPNYTAGPAPSLTAITLRLYADPGSALIAFSKGDLDALPVAPLDLPAVEQDPTLAQYLQREATPTTLGLEFNGARPPFSDPRVRLAFARAIDRQALDDTVFGGSGVATSTWLPDDLPGADPANAAVQQFDPAAAQQLLAAAGYPGGANLPPVALMLSNNATNMRLFQFLQQQLQQNLGVTVTLGAVDSATRAARINAKDFQVVYGGWGQDYPDADDWLPIWTSRDTNNMYNYSDPRFDGAVTKALAERDAATRAGDWSAAEKILLQDAPVAALRHGEILTLWQPWVQGLQGSGDDQILYGDYNLDSLSISPQR